MSLISALPKELLVSVFSFLDERKLCKVESVCKEWLLISRDNALWRPLCLKNFKVITIPTNWKAQFSVELESKYASLDQAQQALFGSLERFTSQAAMQVMIKKSAQIVCAKEITRAVVQDPILRNFFHVDQKQDEADATQFECEAYTGQVRPLLVDAVLKILGTDEKTKQYESYTRSYLQEAFQSDHYREAEKRLHDLDQGLYEKVDIMRNFLHHVIPAAMVHTFNATYELSGAKIAVMLPDAAKLPLQDTVAEFDKIVFITMLHCVRHHISTGVKNPLRRFSL